jgi:hypothetical protein
MRTEEYLILDRDDLLPLAKNRPTLDIIISNFKFETYKKIQKCNLVLFIDDHTNEMKIIKCKYIIYNE